ncbi:tannase/feruloyl esterase family alpha/beta hydrolase [Pseudomaricurvus alcaniphilus]|uniref:tannase/feruloyl esterase family alpha/beta hydrolase n=1 Tax=Pseudomaricurvus alcaniphilus TaxID=1166482 RepID=UPI003132BB1F
MGTLYRVAPNFYRYMVLEDLFDESANADIADFLFKANVNEILEMSEEPGSPGSKINTLSTDLSEFRKAGGKLIQYHGWNDPSMPAAFYTQYYKDVVNQQPGDSQLEEAQSFYRLFMVPGMGHCRGGYGPTNIGALSHLPENAVDPTHDILEALDRWVDKGIAPSEIIATSFLPSEGPQRQMPVCAYPKTARYLGGDESKASSYSCVDPTTH